MRVLIIPDTHAPYHHTNALDFLRDLKRAHKPELVVHIGDLGDQHGWSRHERQPDALGQGDEDRATLLFCRKLYRLFPRVLACVGNHDARLAKRCVRAGIPSRLHRSVGEVYESPEGWNWAGSHVVGNTIFIHGEGFSGRDAALKAAISHRANTVIGHVHSAAGVMYSSSLLSTIWGLSTGCLVDSNALCFSYARTTAAKPVLGAGLILDGIPHFEPLR